MAKIWAVLQKEYEGKYSYLRLKSVDVSRISKKIYITFSVPEDIFDYQFENADAQAIKDIIEKNLSTKDYGYTVYLYFEKIYYDEDILRSSLTDFILSNYPYVGANIQFEDMELSFDEDINILFVIQKSVFEYSQKSGFERGVKSYLQSKYYVNCNITYEIVDNIQRDFQVKKPQLQALRSIFIPVTVDKTICGKQDIKGANPMHIEKIEKTGDNITICGKMSMLDSQEWDKSRAIEGKRFYKYHHQFILDDTSASIRVLYNTNEKDCAINNLPTDTQLLVKGRIFYQEQTGKFIMFAKYIALCVIDFDTVKAQLTPLDPPKEYKILPQKYTGEFVGQQLQLDIFEPNSVENKTGSYVVMHYLSIPKINDKIIYEIAMLKIIDGKFTECYHTYTKAPRQDKMSIEVSTKVTIAPRLTSVIPDIIKFTKGYTVVALNVVDAIKKINQVAKPLRYIMQNELKEIFPESIRKKTTNFYSYCKENELTLNSDSSAMDYVCCMGELLLREK